VPRIRPSTLLIVLLALMLAPASALAAALAQADEVAVKADFIPKFARYVQWPADVHPASTQPFQLCVIGHDPFGPLLERAAADELVDGHAIVIRRMETPEGAEGCHMAFVEGPAPDETGRFLFEMRARPVLTITDARAGPQRGMIHFTNSAGRVRFFIDEAAAAERGISISSRLLALALGVRQRRS